MKKHFKPTLTFIVIWIIISIVYIPKPSSLKVIDTTSIEISQLKLVKPALIETIFNRLSGAIEPTLVLIALYLFILLIIDAIKKVRQP
jgi:hypothetical protein